ncbi:MAG: hypothetical protein AAGA90_19795 [Actinomycetota bacterium]
MKKHLFVLTLAVAMVATACGGDDGGGDTSAPTDPRGEQILAMLADDEDFPLTESEANCTANNMLDDLDDATIDALINDPDAEMGDVADPEEAVVAVDALLDCIDLEAMMVEQMTADGSMTADQAQCVADEFGEDDLRSFIRASALPEDQVDDSAAEEFVTKLFSIAGECGLS